MHRVVPLTFTLAPVAGCAGHGGSAATPDRSATRPLIAQLPRFTAANVPAMGPAETVVAPRSWDRPIPDGLPGIPEVPGESQH